MSKGLLKISVFFSVEKGVNRLLHLYIHITVNENILISVGFNLKNLSKIEFRIKQNVIYIHINVGIIVVNIATFQPLYPPTFFMCFATRLNIRVLIFLVAISINMVIFYYVLLT